MSKAFKVGEKQSTWEWRWVHCAFDVRPIFVSGNRLSLISFYSVICTLTYMREGQYFGFLSFCRVPGSELFCMLSSGRCWGRIWIVGAYYEWLAMCEKGVEKEDSGRHLSAISGLRPGITSFPYHSIFMLLQLASAWACLESSDSAQLMSKGILYVHLYHENG